MKIFSEDGEIDEAMGCAKCGRRPADITEYADAAEDLGISADDYVRQEEGTYNPTNEHFLCTECYIAVGMPSRRGGWVTP